MAYGKLCGAGNQIIVNYVVVAIPMDDTAQFLTPS